MKVGIVTLFDNNNFGNRLQNYALQEILLKYADDVITIKNKFYPKKIKEKIFRISPFAESVLVNRICGKKRKAAILKFSSEHIKTTKKCYFYDKKYNTCPENCDYYCAGSDQIWNPELGRIDGFNYLDFSPYERNFSFSASFGADNIDTKYHKYIKKGISNIKNISLRENNGINIIKKSGIINEATILIDPTLYVDEKQWCKVSSKPNNISNEKYMLLYFLGGISNNRKQKINEFAKLKKVRVIDILDKKSKLYNIGPSEFLYLIKNASLVCTDSFHASVFSFIFEVPLAIFDREGQHSNMGGRLTNLAEKFGLQRCFAKNDTIPDDVWNADYSFGKEILKDERKKVDKFLNKVFYTNADSAKNGID